LTAATPPKLLETLSTVRSGTRFSILDFGFSIKPKSAQPQGWLLLRGHPKSKII
jgi:hypothetical protein